MRLIKPLIVILTTCAGVQISACSTSASMRVEVDVYKGPLSRTRQTQVGELNGTIETARVSLANWHASNSKKDADDSKKKKLPSEARTISADLEDLVADLTQLECGRQADAIVDSVAAAVAANGNLAGDKGLLEAVKELKDKKTDAARKTWLSSATNIRRIDGPLAAVERTQAAVVVTESSPPPSIEETRTARKDLKIAAVACAKVFLNTASSAQDNDAVREFAISVASLSTRMAGLATSITTSELLHYSKRKERPEIVRLAVMLGEYANLLAARADVLSKQVADTGADPGGAAARLGTSDHLRDASTTEFLTLLNTLDATNVSGRDYRRSDKVLGDQARVRLAQQLFADQYWTRINDVYSSGQGDVRMALIKDDIGNWSQKSFDNDPTELLDAYRSVGLAALKSLTKIAKGGPAGNLQMVSDLATNRIGSTQAAAEATADLKRERDQALVRLKGIEEKSGNVKTKYNEKIGPLATTVKETSESADTDRKNAETLRNEQDQIVQEYLKALDKSPQPADIEELKRKRIEAEGKYSAATTKALDSQKKATEAKAELDKVQTPYRKEMQAALEEASRELDTLSRIATALQEASSSKPDPKPGAKTAS